LLRLVSEEPQPVETDPEAVASLERDGLVRIEAGHVSLPS
jgi:hypothetical protein